MNRFTLDERLEKDCIYITKLKFSHLLLMNNALIPWFILVPECDVEELTDLPLVDQKTVLEEIKKISTYIESEFKVDKLNIGAIGNIVSQLHIHVVGRFKNDYAWPNVVWGIQTNSPYTKDEISKMIDKFNNYIKHI